MLTVSSQPSPIVRYLINEQDYHLVDLPYADSLRINGLLAKNKSIDPRQIESASISPFLYGFDPPSPPEVVETLGVNLLIVANQSIESDTVKRVCAFVYDGGFGKSITGDSGFEKLAAASAFDLHEGAKRFLDSKKPASTHPITPRRCAKAS